MYYRDFIKHGEITFERDESYLEHHGIKGQKWGIRRYQNEDGSLTPAGIKRYGTVENFKKMNKAYLKQEKKNKIQKQRDIEHLLYDNVMNSQFFKKNSSRYDKLYYKEISPDAPDSVWKNHSKAQSEFCKEAARDILNEAIQKYGREDVLGSESFQEMQNRLAKYYDNGLWE